MPKPFQFKTGSLIYAQTEGAERIFLLQNGKVSLVYEDIETGDDLRDQVQPGEFFGVRSALGRFPREENAIALADSTVTGFTVAEFETLALSNNGVMVKIFKMFSGQMRRIHAQASRLAGAVEQKPDEGLFAIGERYLKLRRYVHAKHIFNRYLACYPAGNKTGRATQNLHVVEVALALALGVEDNDQAKGAATKSPAENSGAADSGAPADKAIDPALSSFARFARVFQPGEIIFSEYESGDTFYLIQSGRVKLVKNAGEFERILDILFPSEMFGEMAILDNLPRTASAIALDEVTALALTAQNFEPLLVGNSQIALKLLRIFPKRIYDARRRCMILALPTFHAKIADVFLILDELETDIDRTGNSREFQTTVVDIAQWAGINIGKAKETLNHFVSQNRLQVHPNRMVLRNINDFSRLVNSRRNQL